MNGAQGPQVHGTSRFVAGWGGVGAPGGLGARAFLLRRIVNQLSLADAPNAVVGVGGLGISF